MKVSTRTRAMSVVEVAVRIDDPRWRDAIEDAEACSRAAIGVVWTKLAGSIFVSNGAPSGEVDIVLTCDRRIRELNRAFRGQDKATDVLAFPGITREAAATAALDPNFAVLLGDIVVAFETARSDALSQDTAFSDHLSHLIIHGMLHLLGYDHQTHKEAVAMERLESQLLAALGIADPYDGHSPWE